MKLLKLEVEGYRSLKNIIWTPGDLNVLIGPNATGKTNLIKVLELLANAADGRLANHVQQEGGMIPMRWDQQPAGIRVKGETSRVDPPIPPGTPIDDLYAALDSSPSDRSSSETGVSVGYELYLGSVFASSSYKEPTEHLVIKVQDDSSGKTSEVALLTRSHGERRIFSLNSENMVDVIEDVSQVETLLSTARKPFPLNPMVAEFRTKMASWTVLQDVWPGRDSSIRRSVVSSNQPFLSPNGENLVQVLHTHYTQNRDFKQEIDSAMSAAFGDEFDEIAFPPDAEQRVQLKIHWRSLEKPVSAAYLSDGTLRFLFLMTVLANPYPPPLVAIEEPELGLHPSMLPIVAEYAAEAAKKTQVIFSTHSPEFLDAFRDEAPTTTVFHCHEGQTMLGVLSGKDLKEWLKGYRLGEYLRTGEFDNWLKDRLEADANSTGGQENAE